MELSQIIMATFVPFSVISVKKTIVSVNKTAERIINLSLILELLILGVYFYGNVFIQKIKKDAHWSIPLILTYSSVGAKEPDSTSF